MKKAIIDLSAIFWRMYHASEGEEQSSAKRKTLGFVRALYTGFDDIVVAVDCPPYKRKEMYPEYKANRPERQAALIEELRQTREAILEDGWAVLTCAGAEADDIIATYCLENSGDSVTIFGTDKDLLQIMEHCPNVVLHDAFNKVDKTANSVLNVTPDKVVDLLALCGDKSDNVPGVKGVGEKMAIKILKEFGSVPNLISIMDKDDDFINMDSLLTSNQLSKLLAAKDDIIMSHKLVQLDYNCDINEERRGVKRTMEVDTMDETREQDPAIEATEEPEAPDAIEAAPQAIVQRSTEAISYKQGLEPIGFNELARTAGALYNSGLYNNFRNPEGIGAAIMAGREMGLGAVASLSSINIIQGKPSMSPQGMLALIMGSGKAEYFDCVSTTATEAVFVTKRVGARSETKLSFTIAEAKAMGLDQKDNWKKQPAVMLRWRAIAALSRLVYPDVVLGVYTPDEMDN